MEKQDFWGMVSSKNLAMRGVCETLKALQCIREVAGKYSPSKIVQVIWWAGEGVEMKPENDILAEQNTDTEAKIATARAARSTMRGQHDAAML